MSLEQWGHLSDIIKRGTLDRFIEEKDRLCGISDIQMAKVSIQGGRHDIFLYIYNLCLTLGDLQDAKLLNVAFLNGNMTCIHLLNALGMGINDLGTDLDSIALTLLQRGDYRKLALLQDWGLNEDVVD